VRAERRRPVRLDPVRRRIGDVHLAPGPRVVGGGELFADQAFRGVAGIRRRGHHGFLTTTLLAAHRIRRQWRQPFFLGLVLGGRRRPSASFTPRQRGKLCPDGPSSLRRLAHLVVPRRHIALCVLGHVGPSPPVPARPLGHSAYFYHFYSFSFSIAFCSSSCFVFSLPADSAHDLRRVGEDGFRGLVFVFVLVFVAETEAL
jgi:hypothetical protein